MHRGSLARRHSRHLPAHGCHLRISHRNRGGANRFWKNEQDYIDHQDEIFIYIYISYIYIYIHISYIYISYYYHIICSWYSCWRIILKILGWWHQGDFQIEKPTEKTVLPPLRQDWQMTLDLVKRCNFHGDPRWVSAGAWWANMNRGVTLWLCQNSYWKWPLT